jgi:hypothetical protein
MNLLLQRFSDNKDSTMGLWFHKEEKKFLMFGLEDEYRKDKVMKETRIPAGFYELKIRAELTPLTKKHREAYGAWFEYHIEITAIPNFSGVYVHAGNDDDHTDGCPLGGNTLTNHFIQEKKPLTSSVDAIRRFYTLVYPHLKAGNKAFVEIRDEQFLFT